MRTKDAPSHNAYSHFRCEKAVITDVNRKTYTCTAESVYSSKKFEDVPVLSPYTHHAAGEGLHVLPEVGAYCYIGSPSDESPSFIMGFVPPPAVTTSEDSDPARSTLSPEGSLTDVSYQANRPDGNPGDMGFTTRDGSFFMMRRGGVVQIGATPIAQRLYIPIDNFIRDFAQNYELSTFAGDLSWTVAPTEMDPGGPACQWVFHSREFATDAFATVRIRHTPLSAPGATSKAAWEVTVAPQGIDPETGAVVGATYIMVVTTGGDQTEVIGASRVVTVAGNDSLTVEGDATWKISGVATYTAQELKMAAKVAELVADKLSLGVAQATEPAILGAKFLQWLSTQAWPVATVGGAMVAAPSPASITALQQALSTKVFLG